jgi:hypothetical protein
MDQVVYGGAIRVHDNALEAVKADGTVAWRWKPSDSRIIGLIPLPAQDEEVIVFVEPLASLPRGVSTLFRYGADGLRRWAAEVPMGGDGTYVAASIVHDHIEANTWDGRSALIDLRTGKIRQIVFAK